MDKTAEAIINNSTPEEQIKHCLEMIFEIDKRIQNIEELYLKHNYTKAALIDMVLR